MILLPIAIVKPTQAQTRCGDDSRPTLSAAYWARPKTSCANVLVPSAQGGAQWYAATVRYVLLRTT